MPYASHFVGATQIVDGDGQVLAARNTADGPGGVTAEITVGSGNPSVAAEPDRFWILRLPLLHRLYWHHQNAVGRSLYRRRGRPAWLAAARDNHEGEIE